MTENHPQYVLQYRGIMAGHTGWVTSIATAQNTDSNVVISGSRDKSIIVWNIVKDEATGQYGVPRRRMTGHSHFVSDVVLSSDAQFALSGSWDNTLRLWDVNTGTGRKKFGGRGHTKSVLSVAFSADNRQIVSGSMDKTIRLWNTLGECKHVIDDGGHSEWVSCVRFSPNPGTPLVVSSSWDKTVKVWNLKDCKLQTTLQNHNGYINTVTVSPDGSLCASAGKDGFALLWDLSEGKHLYSLDAGDVINALVFSPDRYWLCAATQKGIRIWDLESKTVETEIDTTHPDFYAHTSNTVNAPKNPTCTSLAWSADGRTLFSGHSDNVIRVWEVRQ